MQKKKVSIMISGHKQLKDGKDEDVINFFTIGEYYKDQDIHILNYEESEVSGLEGTKTTLTVRQDSVVLKREGNYFMCQTFRVQQKEYTTYETPYGELLVEIIPTKVESKWSMEGGSIDLSYFLSVGGQDLGHHHMSINVINNQSFQEQEIQ